MFFVTFKDASGTYLLNYLYCISPSDSEDRNNVKIDCHWEILQNRYSAVRQVTASGKLCSSPGRWPCDSMASKGYQYNPLSQLRNSYICVLGGRTVLSCWVIISLESKELHLKDRRPQAVWLSVLTFRKQDGHCVLVGLFFSCTQVGSTERRCLRLHVCLLRCNFVCPHH